MNRRPAPDRSALGLTIGVHGAFLLVFLLAPEVLPPPVLPSAALTLFDISRPPPPPNPPARHRPRQSVDTPAGGSPSAVSRPRPHSVDATPMVTPQSPIVTIASSLGQDLAAAELAGPASAGEGEGEEAGIGIGDGSGPGPPRYARAEWIHMPTFEEMLRYWPAVARERRIAGNVELACIVPKPGKPKRCWVLSERPQGIGFGRAALAMSRVFRIKPVFRNDDVFDLPVVVPIVFNVPPKPTPPKL